MQIKREDDRARRSSIHTIKIKVKSDILHFFHFVS
jgi:hypothetical protein